MRVLNFELTYTNTILLTLDGGTPRFSSGLYAMIRQMTSIFGSQWWDYTMIGVTKWSYEQDEIDDRYETCTEYPDHCKDEAWFIREVSKEISEKFGVNR